MTLGFGITETQYEEEIERAMREFVAEKLPQDDLYFTKPFVDEVRSFARTMATASQERGDKYKDSLTYPDRYSYFWSTVISDASHIVFILTIHHVNRRHTASPDGWTLLTSERIFYVALQDIRQARRSRANEAAAKATVVT